MRRCDRARIHGIRGGERDSGGSPGRRSLSCSTAPSSRAAGSLPGTPAQQGRAERSAGGGQGWVVPEKRPPLVGRLGGSTPDGAGVSGTPFPTHLQDEGLAVEGNLNGVHSVPILLWQGQRVTGRRVEGTGGEGGTCGLGTAGRPGRFPTA